MVHFLPSNHTIGTRAHTPLPHPLYRSFCGCMPSYLVGSCQFVVGKVGRLGFTPDKRWMTQVARQCDYSTELPGQRCSQYIGTRYVCALGWQLWGGYTGLLCRGIKWESRTTSCELFVLKDHITTVGYAHQSMLLCSKFDILDSCHKTYTPHSSERILTCAAQRPPSQKQPANDSSFNSTVEPLYSGHY